MDAEKKIIDFFSKYTNDPIDLDTEINNHLGLVGDDVHSMLIEFSKKFGVSFENLDLSDYFLEEMVFEYWYYKFFNPKKLIKKPLNIRHMLEVAQKGEWFEPI